MSPAPLDCLLVTYPIESIHSDILEQMRALFKTVHFYPGEDGSGTETEYKVVLPPPEVYAAADAIFAFVVPENLTHISQMPRLKLWQVMGSGTKPITDSAFYQSIPPEHPLVLSNIAGVHAVTIAEHVLMTSLMHFHRMDRCIEASRQGHWAGPTELGGLFIREMRSLTVGIITYGHIAREIGRLAAAFGSRVIVCTREGKPKTLGGYHIEGTGDVDSVIPSKYYTTDKKSLHDFLAESDIVVNMMPSSAATYQFIGREELKAMKDNALLVNCGRGETVDTEALIAACSAKDERTGATGALVVGGASLDVTDPEPLPDGHILYSLPNVIITPHCSWASENIYRRVVELLKGNKKLVEEGKPAMNSLRG
ncbi:hypothetical protein JCM6882_001198 [Rhodosporidiobolus microsporus]